MPNMHLVTGYAGFKHVTSDDQGSFNAAILSDGEFVLERGRMFDCEVISNNVVRVFDGDALMQGRHVRLKENTYVDLYFDNGSQGKRRIDIVAIRYNRNQYSDIESCDLVVIKGKTVDDKPEQPELTRGDILNEHANINEMPLYAIEFDGLYIQQPICLFSSMSSFRSGYKKYDIMLSQLNWVGSENPYTYTLNIPDVKENSDVQVLPASTITADQVESWSGAMVMSATQAAGSITLKAFGDKPEVNIPITVLVGSEVRGE